MAGNNTYTFSDLKKAVVHALGGNPDQNITPDQIVNGALSQLANLAPWRWRQKALSLASVSGQNFINLPTDFQEFLVVQLASSATGCMEAVTIDQLIRARSSGSTTLGYGGASMYCLDWTPQTSVTVEPQPILQLYPTPAATTTPYVIGTYLRQIPKLTNLTDLPDIPGTWHELLLIWCRAYAAMLETGQFGADYQMFQNMLPQYERLDGRSAGYVGRMRGGLSQAAFGPAMGSVASPS